MAAPFPLMRKARSAFLAAGLTIVLAGCGNIGSVSGNQSDIGKIGALLLHEIRAIGSSPGVPRERAAAIPYASLGVRLGGSDEAMFVLAGKSGDDLLWLGGNVAVTTRHGRIVRTVGFKHNISGVHAAEGVKQDLSQLSVNYLYDFAEQARYGIAVKCTRQNLGAERIVIIGVSHDTSHVAEECNATSMDWSFRNEFWADSTGFVWQSRQFIEPRVDSFTLEVLRPAS